MGIHAVQQNVLIGRQCATRLHVLLPGLLLASLLAAASTAAAADKLDSGFAQHLEGSDFQGVWRVDNYVGTGAPTPKRILKTADGELAPLQPWAQAIYDARIADNDRGEPFASTTAYCLPAGVPLMMRAAAYPIQILQTPVQLTMLFEENGIFRIVHVNGRHPQDPEPAFMGHSIGRWEGDTLLIDTVGLTKLTTLDTLGMPHTEQLHVVERIRRIAPDKLEDVMLLDDSGAFTRPWTLRQTYTRQRPDTQLLEYVCSNQRNEPKTPVGVQQGGS